MPVTIENYLCCHVFCFSRFERNVRCLTNFLLLVGDWIFFLKKKTWFRFPCSLGTMICHQNHHQLPVLWRVQRGPGRDHPHALQRVLQIKQTRHQRFWIGPRPFCKPLEWMATFFVLRWKIHSSHGCRFFVGEHDGFETQIWAFQI